jgi:hypothetical protein
VRLLQLECWHRRTPPVIFRERETANLGRPSRTALVVAARQGKMTMEELRTALGAHRDRLEELRGFL